MKVVRGCTNLVSEFVLKLVEREPQLLQRCDWNYRRKYSAYIEHDIIIAATDGTQIRDAISATHVHRLMY